MPIPVHESASSKQTTVFGKNTIEQLESNARARALAKENATYGRGKYEADHKQRTDE